MSLCFVALVMLALHCGADSAVASPLAYITNSADGTISVIDTDTNTIATTVTSTILFPAHVAVNAAGTRVYVTALNSSPPSVRVLDAQSNTYIGGVSIPVFAGTFFTNLILSPTQPFAFLGAIPDLIFPIDLGSNTLGTTIIVPVSGGDEIRGVAIDPTGTTLYATKDPSGDISVIDVASGLETATIPGGGLRDVVVDPAGAFVYAVSESLFGSANVIVKSDAGTNTVVDSEDYGVACTGLRAPTIDASGTTLYANCLGTGSVAVIDTATLGQTPVTVGFLPTGASLTPDGARLYVTNQGDGTVSVIDTSTNTVVDTVPVGDSPLAVGSFIGPDFVCGNGVLEPGEGCDDGNVLDGDGCSSTCYSVRDAVVSPIKPIKLTIPTGDPFASKTLKVKVLNTDSEDRSVLILANSTNCGSSYAVADFGAGPQAPVTIAAGKSVKGSVVVTAVPNSLFQPNYEAPIRCTFTVTAYANPEQFTIDSNPSNNVSTFDVDILDEGQPEMSVVHDTTIAAVKPLKLTIKDGSLSAAKTAKFKAGNADYLPTPEPAASHSVSIVALDGDCPAASAGTPTIDGGATADIEGGADAKGEVTMTLPAAGASSASKRSPARCVATVTANGPPGDMTPANNTATIQIDVVDYNDF
jgi:YVTN family beta-propeller protein/cysteine-rich repeat protein